MRDAHHAGFHGDLDGLAAEPDADADADADAISLTGEGELPVATDLARGRRLGHRRRGLFEASGLARRNLSHGAGQWARPSSSFVACADWPTWPLRTAIPAPRANVIDEA
ncbi:MAG TPA: hypothetical protein VF711_13770, partial [Acidimicrobiales bacterium]